MPIQITMPALSPTMTEGTLAKWLKKEGDAIAAGDVVCEIETDKATMEVEAVDEGTLGRILVAEGSEGVPVNQVIALILAEGEDASALDGAVTKAAPAPAPVAAPTPAAPAAIPPPVAKPSSAGGRVFASPLAKRLARDGGLDISVLSGSGPHGRIVKRDVEAALASAVGPAAMRPVAAAAPAYLGGLPAYEAIPNSTVRKVVARRLTESKQTVPHFYLTVDCRIDKLLEVRKELNTRLEGDGLKLSVNDMIIKASAVALIKVPAANAMWTEDAILRFKQADISVAVAIDGGLITPIVRGANAKGLAEISGEMKDLAARARDGKLAPEEYQGGSFSISNLGMFGIKEFAAIINPPQGCILAVGAGEQRPVVSNGALGIATVMTCTLSVDHRAVDGAVGAQFLAAFKPLIEDPLTLLL